MYQSADFNKGVSINGATRYTLTIRQDGTIKIKMYYQDNKPTWSFSLEYQIIPISKLIRIHM